MNQQEINTYSNTIQIQAQQSINQSQKVTQPENSSVNPSSTNKKWQQIIEQQQKQDQQTPFLLTEESFKSENINEEYPRQKSMMQQAASKGRQFLINKDYQQASKQLSKTIMAFQFIAKNHGQTIGKQQLKEMMISTVLPTYSNLSLCYLKLKNYELVVSLTNQVLGQDPDNVKARYRRALAYQEMKRTDQAVKDYQMIKKLDTEMQKDCNQKIIECRAIETEQRKRRKLAAQKFLSGYQSEDIKQKQQKFNTTLESQNVEAHQVSPDTKSPVAKYGNLLQWVREKCLKCTKILRKISSNKQEEQKQE